MADNINKLLDSAAFDAAMEEIGTRVKANFPTITMSELDNIGTAGSTEALEQLARRGTHLRFRVTMGPRTLGFMDVFTDSIQHVLTEVITTHAVPDDDGRLTDKGHVCNDLRTYFRSYNFASPTLTNAEGTWSEWRELSSSKYAVRIGDLEEKLADSNFLTAAEAKAMVAKYF